MIEFFMKHMWIIKMAVGLLSLTLLYFILSHFIKKYQKQKYLPPLRFIATILFFMVIVYIAQATWEWEGGINYIFAFFQLFLVVCLTWLFFIGKNELQKKAHTHVKKKKWAVQASSIDFIGKLFSIILFFVALLFALLIFGVDIMPLLAFGGIGAAAIGLAAKDVIANFFGGLMLYITRPFSKGDFIDIPAKNIMGGVEEIGWYLTEIRDLQKTPIYLPNSTFSNAQIKNYSRRTHRRIEETISVRYADFTKVPQILEKIKQRVSKDPQIDQTLAQNIYFSNFAATSLDIVVQVYLTTTDYAAYMEIKQNLLIDIKNILNELGADIPFPTTTVELFDRRV